MTDREINEQLDLLCALTWQASVLNVLHACRPDHPLGRDNPWKWRSALACVKANRSLAFLGADLRWLETQAINEWAHHDAKSEAPSNHIAIR